MSAPPKYENAKTSRTPKKIDSPINLDTQIPKKIHNIGAEQKQSVVLLHYKQEPNNNKKQIRNPPRITQRRSADLRRDRI